MVCSDSCLSIGLRFQARLFYSQLSQSGRVHPTALVERMGESEVFDDRNADEVAVRRWCEIEIVFEMFRKMPGKQAFVTLRLCIKKPQDLIRR